MSILPSVRAALAERFIFNFRLPPEALVQFLPAVPWLAPQPVNGFGVASFCVLDLRGITVAPLPTTAGLTSISCAPRYAVLDASSGVPTPAVFVTERQTSSAFGAWFTSLGFSAPHPHMEASIRHEQEAICLDAAEPHGETLFSAVTHPASSLHSELFSSASEFAAFIAQGVTSYGLSRHGSRLTKMDLHKDDADYEPLQVSALHGPLVQEWQAAGGILDSAFRTCGGRYEWTYHGLTNGANG